MPFQKATKENLFLRLAIQGPSGSGKTRSALEIGTNLGDRLALIDTEERSSCRYAHLFDFDIEHLTDGNPNKYIEAIREARGHYDVLVVDSFSHAWFWELETVDKNFRNWAAVRPIERQLLKAIISFPGHVIVTMRSKTEWVLEEGTNKKGKPTTSPKKVGTASVQSPGVEYEFDVVGEMDLQHVLRITKSRFDELDGVEVPLPGKDFADQLTYALTTGGVPTVNRVPTMSNSEQIHDLLNELGVTDREQRRALGMRHLKGRKAGDLTNQEIEAVLTAIRQEFDSLPEEQVAAATAETAPTHSAPAEEVTQTNNAAIADVLDELGITDVEQRQSLVKLELTRLNRRKVECLTPDELQFVLTTIRQSQPAASQA